MSVTDPRHAFILGAAKCGTTFLANLLNEQSNVCLSSPKEPLFFESTEFNKGIEHYYSKYFHGAQRSQVTLDARHRNLLLPFVAQRIKSCIYNPKFIVLVRNPVDRLFSHWWHWKVRGIEKRSLNEIMDLGLAKLEFDGFNPGRLENQYPLSLKTSGASTGYSKFEAYVASGKYKSQIQRYHSMFGKNSTKILFFESLVSDQNATLKDCCNFLHIDFEELTVKSSALKNTAASQFSARARIAFNRLPFHVPIPGFAKKVMGIIEGNNSKYRSASSAFKKEFRSAALNHYLEDISWLENETGKQLTHWTDCE